MPSISSSLQKLSEQLQNFDSLALSRRTYNVVSYNRILFMYSFKEPFWLNTISSYITFC